MNVPQDDFVSWLNRAVRGLPNDTAEMVREELTWHYEDAVRDHMLDGLSPSEAHHAALAELGDVQETAAGLQHTHLSAQRYLKAALVGVGYLLTYGASIPINRFLGGGNGFNPANFLLILYILHSFKIIFADRFSMQRVTFHSDLIVKGIKVVCVTRLMGWAIYNHPTITESYTRGLWSSVSPIEMLLNLISLSGLLIVAVSLIILGEQVFRLNENFYGLHKAISLLVAICGLGLAGFGIAATYGISDIGMMAGQTAVVAGTLVSMMWVFIFFHAGRKNTPYTA